MKTESKYRITHSTCHKSGETLWVVEKYIPEVDDWGIVKVFHTKAKAEEHKQALEMYGKKHN